MHRPDCALTFAPRWAHLVMMAQVRAAYVSAASQLSFPDEELKALEPCPYAFHFAYHTADSKTHTATCDDWETAAAFYRFEKVFGADGALAL